jgi:tRNA threonylcarbamoyl adenosine modification protein (Sua5/YciO/YrdC/YwlC family)
MTQRFTVHPEHPQPRLMRQVAQILQAGGIAALPTDACYVFACTLDDKSGSQRLRALRALGDKHLLTLLCPDLSALASYAQVDNWQYRFLKEWTPGPYTFVLPATKQVPKRLSHPSRKTIGLRVPASTVLRVLFDDFDHPLLCTSLIPIGSTDPLQEPDEVMEQFQRRIDCVVDAGSQGVVPTTVIDLTGEAPRVLREGLGPVPAGLI